MYAKSARGTQQVSKVQKESDHSPLLVVGAIVEIYKGGNFQGIVLIDRAHPPVGKALPGGKIEIGETVEQAVRREIREEVGLDLQGLEQFHAYSDPAYAVEIVHLARAYQEPTAGDDAGAAKVFKLDEIPWNELAFYHARVLRDYISYRKGFYWHKTIR